VADQILIDKIRSLPPEKVAEVEDFVNFRRMRDEDRLVTQAAAKLSEEALEAARNGRLLITARSGQKVLARLKAPKPPKALRQLMAGRGE
jgi:hypothetical protein